MVSVHARPQGLLCGKDRGRARARCRGMLAAGAFGLMSYQLAYVAWPPSMDRFTLKTWPMLFIVPSLSLKLSLHELIMPSNIK